MGWSNSNEGCALPLRAAPNFSPRPASTPKKVLSMSGQSVKSKTNREKPFWERLLTRSLKSTLELKLALPEILIQAFLSPTETTKLGTGVFIRIIGGGWAQTRNRLLTGYVWFFTRLVSPRIICTKVCCKTSASSRLLKINLWLHSNKRLIAAINS